MLRCQTVSVEVRKSQHKYVIGPRGSNLSEILAETGVSVEVPPLDSGSETITLRGEQDKLGPALTLVYSKVRLYGNSRAKWNKTKSCLVPYTLIEQLSGQKL
jgi:polyribonucleotide nucleotidyltransferase